MANLLRLTHVVVFLSALLCAQPSIAADKKPVAAKTLTIAADVWCPINCEPDAQQVGIGIELAKSIFEPLGYKINYVVMPWTRALEEVRAGKIDAVVGANTADEDTLIFPKEPIYGITDDFYVLRDNPLVFKTVDSLRGKRLGVIAGYGYSETLNNYLTQNRKISGELQEVSGDTALEQNIKKLLARRVDVIIESQLVMDYTLRKMQLTDKIKHIGSIPQGNVYLAFSPALGGSKDHAHQYDKGVTRLRASGALNALYAAYGLKLKP